ncbi:MAG: hypothetical protein E7270_05385 [Lachnospiraceae bacterium]|nr:hypothetical protein [Lachnospiraceae bacterium]
MYGHNVMQQEQEKNVEQKKTKKEKQELTRRQIDQTQQQHVDENNVRISREEQIRNIRANCRILQPEISIQNNAFAKKSSESLSAGKRRTRSKMLGSALRKKRLNAERLDVATAHYQQGMEVVENDNLIRSFLDLNLSVDLRNDDAIVAESQRLEEITARTQAVKKYLKNNPQVREQMSEEEQIALDTKLEIATDIYQYYQIQKKVITNTYYRTHYNSEISSVYSETDSLEQRNLTLLIWQSEAYKNKKGITGKIAGNAWLANYTDEIVVGKKGAKEAQNRKEIAVRARFNNVFSDREYGKNVAAIEDSPHAEYFRLHDREGDPIYENLSNRKYQVTGIPITMSESFARYLSNIPRMKAIQNMKGEDVQGMIEDLVKTPQDVNNIEEVKRCREANIRGLRVYKEVLKTQMNYLKRKYGNGFLLLSPEEIANHNREFDNDFTNMQGATELINYMERLRNYGVNILDDNDVSDMEMCRLVDYYQNCAFMEGTVRNLYLDKMLNFNTYSDYKRHTAIMIVEHGNPEHNIQALETMHLDVRWDTKCNEFEDVVSVLTSEKIRQKLEGMSEQQLASVHWYEFFEEYGNDEFAIATKIVENEVVPHITMNRDVWRDGGLTFGSIRFPGVGTDDFAILNNIYKNILADEAIRADYGITTPEIMNEFTEFMEKSAEAGEIMKTYIAYANEALRLVDSIRATARTSDEKPAKLLRKFANVLERVADVYIDKEAEYRNAEGNQLFTNFARFRERIGMWTYPMHREVMENYVEPAISKLEPTENLQLADGTQIPVMPELIEQLQGHTELKDGVNIQKLQETINKYNAEEARFKVLDPIYKSGEVETEREKVELWSHVKRKHGFFLYDIAHRIYSCVERKEQLLAEIKGMFK